MPVAGHSLSLLRSIESGAAAKGAPKVAILSVQAGDGSSAVIRSLAEIASLSTKRVILVDLAKHAGASPHASLGWKSVGSVGELTSAGGGSIVVVPSNEMTQTGSQGGSLRTLLDTAAGMADLVLIDAPQIIGGDQMAEAVARVSDQVYLVVRQQHTSRPRVAHCVERLMHIGVAPVGIVLNDRTFPIPGAVHRFLFASR